MTTVVFDLDGILVDSEHVWDEVREGLAHARGGRWTDSAQRAMMGMSSPEWSRYMHDTIGLSESPAEINRIVVQQMLERYAAGPPWLPGALEAVRRMAAEFTLGLASSSNRELIDAVLEAGGLTPFFRATVSSEEVPRGKPAPDVYLEAARRLGVDPGFCVAIEDSHNGIRSAKAAGMACIAIPNDRFPPGDAVAEADLVLGSIGELTIAAVKSGRMTVEAIAIGTSDNLQPVESVEAVEGCGLYGDRHYRRGGQRPGGALTLIEAEVLEDVGLSGLEARRQVVVRGVRLNDLVGKRFRVGEIECAGVELCEPCEHLQSLTRPGIIKELVHRGGLNADILSSGTIAVGDTLVVLADD